MLKCIAAVDSLHEELSVGKNVVVPFFFRLICYMIYSIGVSCHGHPAVITLPRKKDIVGLLHGSGGASFIARWEGGKKGEARAPRHVNLHLAMNFLNVQNRI